VREQAVYFKTRKHTNCVLGNMMAAVKTALFFQKIKLAFSMPILYVQVRFLFMRLPPVFKK